jgi:hypothetical protein
MFKGLSTLRKDEEKKPKPQNAALQDYLKKYTDGASASEQTKKKKKKKPKPQGPSAVQIIDNDDTGFDAGARRLNDDHEDHDEDGQSCSCSSKGSTADICTNLINPAYAEGPVVANKEEAEAFKYQLEKVG